MESIFKHYWCHICRSDLFQGPNILKCISCGSELIEEVENNSVHPSSFRPQGLPSRRVLIPTHLLMPIQIIHFFLQDSDDQSFAATEEQVSSLETVNDPCGDCSICQEKLEEGAKRTKCKHEFHENCIVPWLKIKDTCPVCRTTV